MLYYNIDSRDDPASGAGAPVGMKWFRSNVKTGSRLALFALALQFALSFGHFHAAAQTAPAAQSGLYVLTTAGEPASNSDSDQRSNDLCAICAVIALANSVMFAPPPPLLLPPQAIAFLYLATDAEFTQLNSAHPAFQSRAPPIS